MRQLVIDNTGTRTRFSRIAQHPHRPAAPPAPADLADALERLAARLAAAAAEPDSSTATLEDCAGDARRVAASLRSMVLLFDRSRADALARREDELKSIALLVGQAVRDLARSNQRLADEVGSQTEQLDEIAVLDPDDLISDRLRNLVNSLHQTTSEVGRDLDHVANGVESSNQRIAALEHELEEARRKALYDGLTKVHSRAALDERLAEQMAADAHEPWCFLLADLDRFKAVNDAHGHLVGDALLFKVAQALQACADDYEGAAFVGRYGGEEFGVILPGATLDRARAVAERMRREVQDARYQLRARTDAVVNPTISIGVAQRRTDDTATTLVDRADGALYQAKHLGRNRVAVASP